MRLLADENFNNEILRGLRRRIPDADLTRVQDTHLAGEPDLLILAWAAENNFIVVSHDVNTMRGKFYERMNAELPVPTLFLINATKPIGEIIDDLELILSASTYEEWEGQLWYLPF